MDINQRKKWIDGATYEELLRRWRFAPAGSLWFQGEIGVYYAKAMNEKGEEAGSEGRVRASKSVGW